jgi:hypothetical protein
MDSPAVRTYNYLRIAIVAAVVLLGVSIVVELLRGDGTVCSSIPTCGSISAFYYTPVHAAFVGTLVAVGVALVAIKGRPGWEDTLLNLAGALTPVVAFAPTPLSPATSEAAEAVKRGVPAEYVPGIINNVWALLVVGALALVLAAALAVRSGELHGANAVGLGVFAALLVAFAGWFVVSGKDLGGAKFLDLAHYVAAIPLFGVITLVVEINARRSGERVGDRVLRPSVYKGAYRSIAVAMGAIIVGAVVLFFLQNSDASSVPAGWLFWVEAALLLLFIVFWVLQTLDYWKDGAPVAVE